MFFLYSKTYNPELQVLAVLTIIIDLNRLSLWLALLGSFWSGPSLTTTVETKRFSGKAQKHCEPGSPQNQSGNALMGWYYPQFELSMCSLVRPCIFLKGVIKGLYRAILRIQIQLPRRLCFAVLLAGAWQTALGSHPSVLRWGWAVSHLLVPQSSHVEGAS